MKQLTQDVRSVMHMRMADRQAGSEPGGSRPELVGRDSAGRFVSAGGSGSAEAMARMKIGISAAQQRWVETEAARRRLPKTVIVRELLDKAPQRRDAARRAGVGPRRGARRRRSRRR